MKLNKLALAIVTALHNPGATIHTEDALIMLWEKVGFLP